jgi:hypothetical protein
MMIEEVLGLPEKERRRFDHRVEVFTYVGLDEATE